MGTSSSIDKRKKKSIGEIVGINSEFIMDFPSLGFPNFCRPKFKFLRAKFAAEVK